MNTDIEDEIELESEGEQAEAPTAPVERNARYSPRLPIQQSKTCTTGIKMAN